MFETIFVEADSISARPTLQVNATLRADMESAPT